MLLNKSTLDFLVAIGPTAAIIFEFYIYQDSDMGLLRFGQCVVVLLFYGESRAIALGGNSIKVSV